jgi:hypothetical protein
MHHPKRAERLPALVAGLSGFSRPQVVTDVTSAGPWPTAKRAWRAVRAGATHHLVLQDDVLLCRDFAEAASRALAVKPDVPVCFYANRAAVDQARNAGGSWAMIADGCWGQAICLPVPLVDSFLAWEARRVRPEFPHDDSRVSMWCVETGRPVWVTVPSLVEHDGHSDSLIGNRAPIPRVARWFIGAERSGLDIDWRQGVDAPPRDMSRGVMRYAARFLRPEV